MLWTLCEILCKVIRVEGVWEQRQTQKHDLLMLERSYFQYFGAKKEKVYDVSGFISQDLRLYSEIQADTNFKKKKSSGLSGYWQPGQFAKVLWMVENEQITSAISWTDSS